LRLDLPATTYSTVEQRRALYQGIEERFATLPRLQVALANQIPLGSVPERDLLTDDRPEVLAGSRPVVEQMTIGANYFETLGARAVRGRRFERREATTDAVAIINERLAALYFSGEEPIGRRIRLLVRGRPSVNNGSNTEWLTIIGVAPNVRQRSIEGGAFDPIVYLPIGLNAPVGANVIVRSDLDPGTVASTLRDRIRTIDPDLPLFDVRTVNQQLAFMRWPQRVFGTMFATFAFIALVLATVGLYAVTAYAATQRTKEIGVRMALGAQASHVWWLVTRNATTQLTVGLVLGGGGAIAISRALPGQLAGTSGSDPVTLVMVACLLIMVALVACVIPARRAMRLNPVVAMRSE
jgi:putative ABC transport system permease protein